MNKWIVAGKVVVNVNDIPMGHVFKNAVTHNRMIKTDCGILYMNGFTGTSDDTRYLTKCIDLGPLSKLLEQCE